MNMVSIMLKTFFQRFTLFSEQEIVSILSLFTKRTIAKADYLVREGDYCEEIAFIESGIFRSFYTIESGDELTYCFRFPDDLVGAYSAFITAGKSIESIQAVVSTVVWVIDKRDLDALANTLPQWNTFLKTIAEQQYLELEQRVIQFQRTTAQERYKHLLFNHPTFVQYLPLQYLASYLGITQRHLSRIRKEISF
ncbi:Crp/Fnr family transcriptional regulator [Myroides sp. M-43]|uniref:Crp/Fnr family transcriptional regulator n=1 Tax=Myroides oncorhynchi TaxID=2893756 RepID=UPI001E4513B2|nr:Crp/Fnr family transcriptional regulator [Myroides oncorhynchi]MCC9043398.1 Crp/Fnr family transcriptional regulator [Myroides oncorhynchi]